MKPCIPDNLPIDIEWDSLIDYMSQANIAIARYDGRLEGIVNANVLLSPISRKEAVLSSRIEGTQASLVEVLLQSTRNSRSRFWMTPSVSPAQSPGGPNGGARSSPSRINPVKLRGLVLDTATRSGNCILKELATVSGRRTRLRSGRSGTPDGLAWRYMGSFS